MPGRYLLFIGFSHYARGGWNDFKGAFPTIEAAKAGFLAWYEQDQRVVFDPDENGDGIWYHVIDIVTGKCPALVEGNYCGGNPDERDD